MNKDWYKAKYLRREELKQQAKERQGWYFITFERELAGDRPYGFTLFNEPFVLFKNQNDKLVCCLLPSCNENDSNVTISLFKVVAKQGEVWFWRGKVR